MPTSEGREVSPTHRQSRWAFAAEARGDLPEGTALRWARQAKRKGYRKAKRARSRR